MSDLADPIPDVPIFKDTLQLPYQPSTSFRLFNSLGDYVMSHLPLIDVVALGNTNRNLRAQVPSHLTRAFHALLQHYFPDHIAFRQAMRDTGAVISGSSALAFIMRDDHWTAKDLDIYVPSGDAATRLFHHLESIQGFKHTVLRGGMPAKDYEKVGSGCIRRVHKFLKRQGADEAGQDMTLTVDLIESDTNSSVQPLTSFHSTLVMNYLTADSVVVLYPSLTFSRVAFKQSRPWKTEDWEEKYTSRGFSFFHDPLEPSTGCGSTCPHLKRSSDDARCMRVRFGHDDRPGEHDRGAWHATWRLSTSLPHRHVG